MSSSGKSIAVTGTWTPQIDQGGTTNIAKTVNYASYVKIGKQVSFICRLALTAGGTAGAEVTVTLPFTAETAVNIPIGAAYVYDTSATPKVALGVTQLKDASKVGIVPDALTGNFWGVDPNLALANGDFLFLQGTYIAAAE